MLTMLYQYISTPRSKTGQARLRLKICTVNCQGQGQGQRGQNQGRVKAKQNSLFVAGYYTRISADLKFKVCTRPPAAPCVAAGGSIYRIMLCTTPYFFMPNVAILLGVGDRHLSKISSVQK